MKEARNSSTALGTAAMRAIESEKPVNKRICYDPYARQLTNNSYYHLIKLFSWFGERYTHGALTFIVCRSRFIDEYLQVCLKSGIVQLIILGAGLDSRAYRQEQFQEMIKIFEVDHPASQREKAMRVKKLFGKLPINVTYIPIDFTKETLDKLLTKGFDKSLKSLFIWEGVTLYLDLKAVDSTLRWITANARSGSSVIFDYQFLSSAIHEQRRRNILYSIISRFSQEKRTFGLEKDKIKEFLILRGFTNVIDTNAKQLTQQYCTNSNKNRKASENYSIVHAEVK